MIPTPNPHTYIPAVDPRPQRGVHHARLVCGTSLKNTFWSFLAKKSTLLPLTTPITPMNLIQTPHILANIPAVDARPKRRVPHALIRRRTSLKYKKMVIFNPHHNSNTPKTRYQQTTLKTTHNTPNQPPTHPNKVYQQVCTHNPPITHVIYPLRARFP